ncbi:MAG: ATP-binding protein [Candidatus Woesearchaeota archaeon]
MIKFKWTEDDRDKKILFEKSFDKRKKRKKDFIIHWENNFDWSGNPFIDTVILPVSHFKAGRENEISELNKFIIQEKKFGIISGEEGFGKTFLMKWLEEELNTFNYKFNIFSIDAKILTHKQLLKKMHNHFTSISFLSNPEKIIDIIKSHSSKVKKSIFLIDNADKLSKESLDLFRKIYSLDHISIIFSITENKKLKDFNDELNLHLDKMDNDSLRLMISKRIESFNGIDIEPFNSIQIKTLAKKASYNPREMLKLCNEKAVDISIKKKDTINPFDEIGDIEIEDDKEIKESLPEGVLEGDMIVQEIVGEFNIDQLENKKK